MIANPAQVRRGVCLFYKNLLERDEAAPAGRAGFCEAQ
jgi:hypothetical protein